MNRVREICTSALEALDAGDNGELRLILEAGLDEPDPGIRRRQARQVCPHCPRTFRFPGELAEHVDLHHWEVARG